VKERAARLARFARALRAEGVGVVLRDELDAAEALGLVDTADRDEVKQALRAALKITPAGVEPFDRLFGVFWAGAEPPPRVAPRPPAPEAPRAAPRPRLHWDPDARTLAGAGGSSPGDDQPGASVEALLRRKPFEAAGAAEMAAMERLLARLARRLATRRSRRLVPAAGRGFADLRRSFRHALRTEGEIVRLARRRRAVEEPRLVFLCDTSGSMDPHGRFLLSFVLALRRAVRSVEVFAFNTELVRLTPWLKRGNVRHVLARLARAVPDWSGGTRIGESLAAFADGHARSLVDAQTVVVVLSDGLDGGPPAVLARAARAVQARARALVWLNPLLGDPRYEPTARGMQAALPFVDHLADAHDLDSLERLLPHLAA
jgi:uncharacterized protein with von Willebrand factor type A (vWA) domain